MGFGASTTVGNVAVDLVQADVDGIIAGIAGVTPKTLADIQDDTSYLYSSSAGDGVADLMQYGGTSAGYLLYNMESNVSSYLSYLSILDYLYSSSAGYGVADELYYYLYDSSNYIPWLQTISELLNGYDSSSVLISNGYTAAYLLEQIYMILSDVWDSGNNALKTIDQAA
jgi:hypothetical protein